MRAVLFRGPRELEVVVAPSAPLSPDEVRLKVERAGICASAASACASGAQEPSHVLAAMGVERELAKGSLRLSLGPATTAADVDRVVEALPPAVERLRALDRERV